MKMLSKRSISVLILFILFILQSNNVFPQKTDRKFWGTNGTLYSITPSPDNKKLYIGGSFYRVGPHTGAGATIDITTGQYDMNFPIINGNIETAVPDGNGGWYVGGYFNSIDNFSINITESSLYQNTGCDIIDCEFPGPQESGILRSDHLKFQINN